MKPSSPSFAAVPSSSLGRPRCARPRRRRPHQGAAGACAPTPPAAAGGGAPRRVPSQTAPLAARRPTLDQETLLILVVLAFLLRCRADRELIWALLYILLF